MSNWERLLLVVIIAGGAMGIGLAAYAIHTSPPAPPTAVYVRTSTPAPSTVPLPTATPGPTRTRSPVIHPKNCKTAVAAGMSAQQAAAEGLDRDHDGVACYGD